jgi:hypothetical protein
LIGLFPRDEGVPFPILELTAVHAGRPKLAGRAAADRRPVLGPVTARLLGRLGIRAVGLS